MKRLFPSDGRLCDALRTSPSLTLNKNFFLKEEKVNQTEKVEEKKIELKPYQIESELKKMYPKMSAGEISRKFNVSRSIILHYLRKFEIAIVTRTSPRSGQRRDDIDRSYHKKQFLKKCFEKGLSIYAISNMCGCAYGQVKHMVEKHGLTELAKKAKTVAEKEVPKKNFS